MSFTVWFTGLSGAGKTTLSQLLFTEMKRRGMSVELLDGDAIRKRISPKLGFSKEERETNVVRLGFFSGILNQHGVAVIVAAIAPYEESRRSNRECIGNYIECYCECDLDILIQRDPKGLYSKALAGEINSFTGISDVYERPQCPEIVVDTGTESPEQSYRKILTFLEGKGLLPTR